MKKDFRFAMETHRLFMEIKYNVSGLLEYGPAHIVYDDDNLWDENILFCVDVAEKLYENPTKENPSAPAWFDSVPDIVVRKAIIADIIFFLSTLMYYTEDERCEEDEED